MNIEEVTERVWDYCRASGLMMKRESFDAAVPDVLLTNDSMKIALAIMTRGTYNGKTLAQVEGDVAALIAA